MLKVAFLFPGQGGYSKGLLKRVTGLSAEAGEVVRRVLEVAREESITGAQRLATDRDTDLADLLREDTDALQLAIYAASTALADALRGAGVRPGVHVGHSFGEIAALTAAGACSVEDGARLVARRCRALSLLPADAGYMLAVSAPRATVRQVLDFLGERGLSIAGQNRDDQTVLSGDPAAMNKAGALLQAAGIGTVRLPSPYPFHSPVLKPIVAAFEVSLRDIRWKAPEVPVYSPILGRCYSAEDDLSALVARQLVEPFDFTTAVRRTHDLGCELFVECGGRQVLTDLTGHVLDGNPGWTAVAADTAFPSGRDIAEIMRLARGGTPTPMREKSPGEHDAGRSDRGAMTVDDGTMTVDHGAVAVEQAPADRTEVFADLARFYAEELEYPSEVFTDEVELEADLGVDSVKQTDLLTRAAERYGLPAPPEGFRITDYATFGRLVDLVARAQAQPAGGRS